MKKTLIHSMACTFFGIVTASMAFIEYWNSDDKAMSILFIASGILLIFTGSQLLKSYREQNKKDGK